VASRPRVFIGSSGAGRDIAKALEMALSKSMECKLWFQDVFVPSRTTIEDLEAIARSEVDLAVFVLTPDDMRDRGAGLRSVARDNVIFELGLFMGALGRNRTFGLICSHCKLDVPTDLLGVTWATFNNPHAEAAESGATAVLEKLSVALRPAVDQIQGAAMEKRGMASGDDAQTEAIRTYSTRGLVTRRDWNNVVRSSRAALWLYGMAELGYASDDETPSILEEAASAGCDIRVLLLDPAFDGMARIDAQEGYPQGALAMRIQAALSKFQRIAASAGDRVRIRTYDSAPTVSLVRGDDRMMVTPYVRYLTGDNSPTIELQRSTQNGMFDRYVRHVESVWAEAKDYR
jgi:hypothetical protein